MNTVINVTTYILFCDLNEYTLLYNLPAATYIYISLCSPVPSLWKSRIGYEKRITNDRCFLKSVSWFCTRTPALKLCAFLVISIPTSYGLAYILQAICRLYGQQATCEELSRPIQRISRELVGLGPRLTRIPMDLHYRLLTRSLASSRIVFLCFVSIIGSLSSLNR